MKMVAFIKGLANTTQTVANASAEIDVWERPQSADIPSIGTDDTIVVLHVSQPYDDDARVEVYRCFEACIDSICEGLTNNENYRLHQAWMLAHSDQIKGIVLTSGGAIEPGRISTAEQKLDKLRPGVAFMPIDVSGLAVLLHEGKLQDALFSRNKVELALKCLSALWPFDLVWQSRGREHLHQVLPNENDFEKAIALRLKNKLGDHTVDWDLNKVEKSVTAVDRILAQGSFADTLDQALERLAQCGTYDASEPNWYSHFTALRKSLLG